MYIFYDDKLADEIIKSDYKFVNEVYINNKKLIGPFGRVNIFIGANNSGKSRFMRGVLKTPKILGVIPSKHEEAFELILTNFKKLLDIIPNNFFMRITFGSPSGYNSFGINLLSNKTLTDYLDINVAGSESEFSKQTLIDFYSKIKLPLFYEKNIDFYEFVKNG